MNKEEYNKIIDIENAKKYYDGVYKERNLEIVKIINNIIKNDFSNKNVRILDLAAGSAQIASLLLEKNTNIVEYIWNDFADEVINYAKTIINDNRFIINTNDCMSIKGDYDIVICVSLEHILDDIKLLNNFSGNTYFCICSPNFNSKGHYRFFQNVNEMVKRYSCIFQSVKNKIIKFKREKYILYGYKKYDFIRFEQNNNNFKNNTDLAQMFNKKAYNYLESDNFSEMYKYVADNIINSVLDVGCWTGMLYKNIDTKNIKYLGFDLCKDAINVAIKTFNTNIFIVNDIYNIINKHFDTIYFGGIFYYIDDANKLFFLNKYIEIVKPKRIIIQDLQQTNLDMFAIYNPTIYKLKLNYDNLNIERCLRQILIIDL